MSECNYFLVVGVLVLIAGILIMIAETQRARLKVEAEILDELRKASPRVKHQQLIFGPAVKT